MHISIIREQIKLRLQPKINNLVSRVAFSRRSTKDTDPKLEEVPDLQNTLARRPSLGYGQYEILERALLRLGAIELRVEGAIVQHGTGTPFRWIVADVEAGRE